MKKRWSMCVVIFVLTLVFSTQQNMWVVNANNKNSNPQQIFSQSADVTSPVFNSINIDKTEASVGEIVTITVDAVDDRVSELNVYLNYRKPITQREEHISLSKNAEGKYVGTYQITNETEAGLWKVYDVSIADDSGNYTKLFNQHTYTPGNADLSNCDFTVSGTTGADVTLPVFNSINIDKTEANVGEIVTITVDAVDDRDSELNVYLNYRKPITQREEHISLSKNAEGKYVGTYQITNETEAGLWKVYDVSIADDSGNYTKLFNQHTYTPGNADLSNCDFTVSGTTGADVTSPVFNSINIDKTEASVGEIVTITVDAVDDRDSELNVHLNYRKPITQREEYISLSKNAEGKYVGTYQITNETEAGLWKVYDISISDDSGNHTNLFNQHTYTPGNTDLSNCDFTVSETISKDTIADISDANLKAKLNRALGIVDLTTDITQEQLKGLTGTLDLSCLGDERIKSIKGLEYCTNISGLIIGAGEITDLSPLAGLTGLEKLDLSMNQITDISPLKDMKLLLDLNLNFNHVSDLGIIANFKNLKMLQLVSNGISDLNPLSELTQLISVQLQHNSISEIGALKNLNLLESLSLGENNKIKDISVLKDNFALKSLHLEDNQICDISALNNLNSLEVLFLMKNQISNISALNKKTALKWLFLGENQIVDISPLSTSVDLERLDLNNNKIADISPLFNLKALQNCSLIQQKPSLKAVNVYNGCSVTSVNVLKDMEGGVIVPNAISSSGIYEEASNSVVWNHVNSSTLLTYDFNKELVIGENNVSFSGSVTQPFEIVIAPPYSPPVPAPEPTPAPNIDETKAIDDIEKAPAGAVIDVPVQNNEPIPVSILESLKGKDVNAVFEFGTYTWSINGKSIDDLSGDREAYDLSVKAIDNPDLSKLSNGEDVLQIEINHNGALPFIGQLSYNVDPTLNGKTVYRYYYNEDLKKLVYQVAAVVQDGKVTFNFEHASTYVFTDSNQLENASIECRYQSHMQDIGWQGFCKNGAISGTTGQSLRLEGIQISVSGSENLGIQYKTHVQNIGWQDFVSDGKIGGSTGKSLRLEAIQILLTGGDAEKYDLYYQVHAQYFGWLGWAKNGESAGTEGFSNRLEAIRILVLPKGSEVPGLTKQAFVKP